MEILLAATDAQGRRLKVVTLEGISLVRRAYESDDFAPGYINFYLCNGAVIAPQFGDKRTDRRSRDIPQEQFADREIIQQNIDGIAAGGRHSLCYPAAAALADTLR
ncbi:agmatine deiminase family protein [Raoultella terrigena]|uniref:agmatine deiminase family protein n=1 Tax=Raoultella TaxID=160674 RepID=UPI002AA5B479